MLNKKSVSYCSLSIPPLPQNIVGKQEVGVRQTWICIPRYGTPTWSYIPNIKSLAFVVAEKSATKNVYP